MSVSSKTNCLLKCPGFIHKDIRKNDVTKMSDKSHVFTPRSSEQAQKCGAE